MTWRRGKEWREERRGEERRGEERRRKEEGGEESKEMENKNNDNSRQFKVRKTFWQCGEGGEEEVGGR